MLRTLAIETFKTLNNENPGFMRKIFDQSPYVSHKKQNLFVQSHKKQNLFVQSHKQQNLFVQSHKTAAFGDKSLKTLSPQI